MEEERVAYARKTLDVKSICKKVLLEGNKTRLIFLSCLPARERGSSEESTFAVVERIRACSFSGVENRSIRPRRRETSERSERI